MSSARLSKKVAAAITGALEPIAQELTEDGDESMFQLVTEFAVLLTAAAATDEVSAAATDFAEATAGPASPRTTGHAQFCRKLPFTIVPPPTAAVAHASESACTATPSLT